MQKKLPQTCNRVKEDQLTPLLSALKDGHLLQRNRDAKFWPSMYINTPMLIAILSDSHDHIPNLQRAVSYANREKAELLIHCGDLISPFMLGYLHTFHGQVHLIYGNNTGDQHLIASQCATTFDNIHHHGYHGFIVADSFRIAFNHYPQLARELALSGAHDLVCYGHDHIFSVERLGNCLLINPGDLLGKDAAPAFALLDTSDFSVHRLEVGSKMLLDD